MEGRRIYLLLAVWLWCLIAAVRSLGDTDTITWGGDNSRSGYQTNHNMDPAVVSRSDFGQIFRTLLPGNFGGIGPEQIYSQPLVYTGSDGIQYVYISTTQNNLYKLDAKTGAIVKSASIHVPFLTADLDGCVDINPTIGITATGVIDPATGFWYFTAKTYSPEFQNKNFGPSNPPGRLNGRYYFHAWDTENWREVAGFPTLIDGTIFRNNRQRMFIGGNQHQRPGLLHVGDFIYTGWASHCVQYNYTGAIIGFNKNTGKIVESFALEGDPVPPNVPGAGCWMSGGGLAHDGAGSMFFSTGNGYASQLKATGNALPGRSPPTSLEEAAVNAKINDDGTLTIIDFFMPWEKTQLDGADKDLGTSPLQILPSDVFTCPNHRRIGVVTGKSGKTYWLNLDNLGGYQQGADGLDAVIQVYQNENSVYAGAAVLPLAGGYIAINVIRYPTHVFKFSCNGAGDAVFTKVADTSNNNAFILGVGHGTTTSLNGQEGSGLMWTSDVDGQNLRIYDPVPPSDGGFLRQLRGFNIPGSIKFGRPAFGNGRAYIATNQGYLYGFGSPVSLPLNCTGPVTFGTTSVGNTSAPVTVNCIANIATTITGIALSGNPNFQVSKTPVTPLQLTAGQSFTFDSVFSPRSVGALSSDVLVNTTNSVTGYSLITPVTLKGNANSAAPLLAINPNTMSFSVIAGQGSSAQSVLFRNQGDQLLTFQNISYSLVSETGPWVQPNVTDQGVQVGEFLLTNVPTSIAPNTVVTVNVQYNPKTAGKHAVYLKGFSNGGTAILDIFGSAGTFPSALFEFEKIDGTWTKYTPGVAFDFGQVLRGTTRNLRFRVTNNGSDTAVPLSLTVSKPPYGVPGIVAAVNNIDLAEGTILQVNQSATATLFCAPPNSQVNVPSYSGFANWTINTGDPNLGKQDLRFACTAIAEQVGPLLGNGTAQYGYVGCFRDNTPGRQLSQNIYNANDNTNTKCLSSCFNAGYIFAGTEYNQECWCGNAIPILQDLERDCNFGCSGNGNQTCGGNGYFHNSSQISLFADSKRFDGNVISKPLQMVQSVGSYGYIGCFQENGGKTFNQKTFSTNNMTVEYCGSLCSSYQLFGLQFGQECYCGTTRASSSTLVADSQCSMTCKGSNSQYCGAGSRMQVYQLGAAQSSSVPSSSVATSTLPVSSSSSIAVSSPPISSSSSSSVAISTLSVPSSSSIAVSSPPTSSSSSSTPIISSIGSSSALSSSTTSQLPSATPTPLSCPSSNNTIYTATTGATFVVDCFVDREGGDLKMVYTNNLEGCINSCATTATCKTFAWIVQGGGACYMKSSVGRAIPNNGIWGARLLPPSSSSIVPSSTPAPPVSSGVAPSSSSIAQSSTPTTISTSSSSPSSSSSSSSSSLSPPPPQSTVVSSSSSSFPSPTSSPTATPSPAKPLDAYSYSGCYTESNPRVLAVKSITNTTTMSPAFCASFCSAYAFFGLEYGSECYCGPYLSAASKSAPESDCNTRCPGNSTAFCGAGNRLSVWKSGDASKINTDPVIPKQVGRYSFYNCVKDAPRMLANMLTNDTLSVESCAAAAEWGGWKYMGVEYERECFFGGSLGAPVGNVSTSECGMTCKGDGRQFCGGSGRLQLYVRA